ncbi:hypothetical protein XENOCAPTIV_022718 [Xenoophorus captivus]|uniref:Uncharacterized protein n=1 Tax=Xenoophorus captivus TaxID=1517983 RepID=A0ABV0S8T4_9TELE
MQCMGQRIQSFAILCPMHCCGRDLNSQSVIFYTASSIVGPAVYGQETGYTLDRSPVHRRATKQYYHYTYTYNFLHFMQIYSTDQKFGHLLIRRVVFIFMTMNIVASH